MGTRRLHVNMHRGEFAQLLAAIHGAAPESCLEWGSGGSTRAILEQCPFVKTFVSIEHDPVWYERVRAEVTDPRLRLHCVRAAEPNPPASILARKRLRWNARAEIERAMFASYVDFPATLGLRFDFVFIDGRARRFCLNAGWALLAAGGLLALHDAQREVYQDVLNSFPVPVVRLEPWHRGQVALVRKPLAVPSSTTVGSHRP